MKFIILLVLLMFTVVSHSSDLKIGDEVIQTRSSVTSVKIITDIKYDDNGEVNFYHLNDERGPYKPKHVALSVEAAGIQDINGEWQLFSVGDQVVQQRKFQFIQNFEDNIARVHCGTLLTVTIDHLTPQGLALLSNGRTSPISKLEKTE